MRGQVRQSVSVMSYRVRFRNGRRGLQATMPTSSHKAPDGNLTISTNLAATTAGGSQRSLRWSAIRVAQLEWNDSQ
jgi:hypothetical protein